MKKSKVRRLECFAGPMDGAKVPFDMTAAGFVACNPNTGDRCHYRVNRDDRDGTHYLHYCDEFGNMVAASRH